MVPRPLPPVAGITIARHGHGITLDSLSSKRKSVRSYLHFLFPLQVQKGSKPDVCLSTTLCAFYNSTASHTLLPGSATGKTIGSLCALPFPHNPPFPEVTQSTMSEQSTYSLLISQLKDCFLPEPRRRAPLKQKVLKWMFFPSWFKFIIYGQWHAIFLNRDCSSIIVKGQCGTFGSWTQLQTASFEKEAVGKSASKVFSVVFRAINN